MPDSRVSLQRDLDETGDSWLWTPRIYRGDLDSASDSWLYTRREPPERYTAGDYLRVAALGAAEEWLEIWRARALPPGTPPHGWDHWEAPHDDALCAAWVEWCVRMVRALGGEAPSMPAMPMPGLGPPVRPVVLYGSDAEQSARSRLLAADSALALRDQAQAAVSRQRDWSWEQGVLALLNAHP